MGNHQSQNGQLDWDLMQDTLPEEILVQIFSHLPAQEIVHKCRLVCQAWKRIADHATVWTTKYEREHGRPMQPFTHPLLDIRKVYVHDTFTENLAASAEVTTVQRRGGIAQERRSNDDEKFPGANSGPFPGCRSVWAASFNHGALKFTIDLLKKGLSQEFIDTVKPPISVSIWTAARSDCSSVFKFTMQLLETADQRVTSAPISHRWALDGTESGVKREMSPQKFSFVRQVEQWMGGDWHEESHTFEEYPVGIRYINCVMEGHDLKYWAGNYGPKFTKPVIRVSMP